MSRGFCAIGLDGAKTTANIGHTLRACGVFGAAFLAVSGRRYQSHPTDAMKAHKHLPLIQCDDLRLVVPFDCVPVAVDLIPGATWLPEYKHPERAFYIFGAEDRTLGNRITDWCRDVVRIPTDRCLNLAACVNVILYDRCAKRGEWAHECGPVEIAS